MDEKIFIFMYEIEMYNIIHIFFHIPFSLQNLYIHIIYNVRTTYIFNT